MTKIIDIEEYAATGKQIPLDLENQYRVRVNKTIIVVSKRIIAAKEILSAAGFNPVNSRLLAHYKKSQRPTPIDGDQKIDLIQGVVRFSQMPIQATDGYLL